MKTTNFKLAIAALSAASFFASMPTMQLLANKNNPVVAAAAQPNINVKVLGQQDEFVILEINLSQANDQHSRLLINDDKGENMYEESVSGKTFSRKIKLAPSEISKIEIVFSTPGVETKKAYSINVAMVSKVNVAEIAKS
jgi:hypothetical protein